MSFAACRQAALEHVSDQHMTCETCTYLNTFAFLAPRLCRCTTPGTILTVCYQEERVMLACSVGKAT